MILFCTTGQTIFYNVIRSTGWTDQVDFHWIHYLDSKGRIIIFLYPLLNGITNGITR